MFVLDHCLKVLTALAVAGCAQAVEPLRPWSSEAARGASIETISIDNQASDATPETLGYLQTELRNGTERCATGPTKYEMIVRLDHFPAGEVGDNNAVIGDVKLVDPATRSVASQYHITALGGVGLIGLVEMSCGPQAGARVFAEHVCRYVFKFQN